MSDSTLKTGHARNPYPFSGQLNQCFSNIPSRWYEVVHQISYIEQMFDNDYSTYFQFVNTFFEFFLKKLFRGFRVKYSYSNVKLQQESVDRKAKYEGVLWYAAKLRSIQEPIEVFDEELWHTLLDRATVIADTLVFIFKDGTKIKIDF